MKQLNNVRFCSVLLASMALSPTASAQVVAYSPHPRPATAAPVATNPALPSVQYNAPIYLGIFNDQQPGTTYKYSYGYSINNLGDVVGTSTAGPSPTCPSGTCGEALAFLWKFNAMHAAPTADANDYSGELYDINDNGVAVGSSQTTPEPFPKPFYIKNGSSVKLPVLYPANYSGVAYAVNNSGVIVGKTLNDVWLDRAVSWTNGAIKDLGTLPGGIVSEARDINNFGVIVGYSYNYSTTYKAVKWEADGTIAELNSAELISQKLHYSAAMAINDSGTIVGYASASPISPIMQPGYSLPVMWNTDGSVSLPPGHQAYQAGEALGINKYNQVVGWFSYAGFGLSTAFLWDKGNFYDLNTLIPPNTGWTLLRATSINDKGEITGYGVSTSFANPFATRAIKLTPKKP